MNTTMTSYRRPSMQRKRIFKSVNDLDEELPETIGHYDTDESTFTDSKSSRNGMIILPMKDHVTDNRHSSGMCTLPRRRSSAKNLPGNAFSRNWKSKSVEALDTDEYVHVETMFADHHLKPDKELYAKVHKRRVLPPIKALEISSEISSVSDLKIHHPSQTSEESGFHTASLYDSNEDIYTCMDMTAKYPYVGKLVQKNEAMYSAYGPSPISPRINKDSPMRFERVQSSRKPISTSAYDLRDGLYHKHDEVSQSTRSLDNLISDFKVPDIYTTQSAQSLHFEENAYSEPRSVYSVSDMSSTSSSWFGSSEIKPSLSTSSSLDEDSSLICCSPTRTLSRSSKSDVKKCATLPNQLENTKKSASKTKKKRNYAFWRPKTNSVSSSKPPISPPPADKPVKGKRSLTDDILPSKPTLSPRAMSPLPPIPGGAVLSSPGSHNDPSLPPVRCNTSAAFLGPPTGNMRNRSLTSTDVLEDLHAMTDRRRSAEIPSPNRTRQRTRRSLNDDSPFDDFVDVQVRNPVKKRN